MRLLSRSQTGAAGDPGVSAGHQHTCRQEYGGGLRGDTDRPAPRRARQAAALFLEHQHD